MIRLTLLVLEPGCVKLIRPRNDGLNWLHPVTCGQDPFGIG